MKTVTMNLYRNAKYNNQIINGTKIIVRDGSNRTCYYLRAHTYHDGTNLFRALWVLANRPTCKRSMFKGNDYLLPGSVLEFEIP